MAGAKFSAPSLDWTKHPSAHALSNGAVDDFEIGFADLGSLVLSYASDDDSVADAISQALDANKYVNVGVDVEFDATEFWCPLHAGDRFYGQRREAEQLVGLPSLHELGLHGDDVHVVVVDQGVNESSFPNNFAGGWHNGSIAPGSAQNGHGSMVARNVTLCAPNAKILDCPLIPPRITALPKFMANAVAAYSAILAFITKYQQASTQSHGAWILVNAWAVYDRSAESERGNYTADPEHPFNLIVGDCAETKVDVVFAAGNCGEHCPDGRCGIHDTGPGESIFGANAHPKVLTVGSVRVDELWIGSSSQGPGPSGLAREKPDLCAPSHFSENGEDGGDNLGSSAAAGMAAGVLALLRSPDSKQAHLSPVAMYERLRTTARNGGNPKWDNRLGYGTIDAQAAHERV